MPREFTVILKQPENDNKIVTKKIWKGINEFVKSPIFVFLFGASIATVYPAFKTLVTPDEVLKQQKIEEKARADAQLIAPFLANLNANEPGKFQASRAALIALQEASRDGKGETSPMFLAVNSAIEAVAIQISPRQAESDGKRVGNEAKPAESGAVDLEAAYNNLKNALVVYIQVDKDDANKGSIAETIRKKLRAKSVTTPSIEKMDKSIMPKNTQVRYFDETDKSKAQDLAAIIFSVTASEVYIAKPNRTAKQGTLEIWMGRN